MKEAPSILQSFEPITLGEMDRVKLMNRTDTKFTFNASQLETVLAEVSAYYHVLEVDGKRISRYKTLYYDTEQLNLYLKHHNGELNRYKIRHRTYVESEIGFLEVKFKSNKGRTIKDRIKKKEVPFEWGVDTALFLNDMLPFDASVLKPVIWVNYSRITLVNKTCAERLTLDLNLEFIKNDRSKDMGSIVIAEVKQEKRTASPFLKVMKKHHVREGSISKYCMGIALTSTAVKKNNFKEKLLTLNSIIHEHPLAGSK